VTPTTSQLVEQVYAAGKAERPVYPPDHNYKLTLHKADHAEAPEWDWVYANHTPIWCAYPESALGWSLVRACWARGLVPQPCIEGVRVSYRSGSTWVLGNPDPDPIRAMCKALMGDGNE